MYYFSGRAGESYLDKEIHAERECIDGPSVHIPDEVVDEQEADLSFCPDCTGNSNDSDDGGESETCEVVMNNGEVCGRELPCSYHS